MAQRGWCGWLFVVAAVFLVSPATATDYLALVKEGARRLERGEYREAARIFQQARDLDMNDALAAAGLGYALDSQSESVDARGELAMALALDGDSSVARWANALCALNAGSLAEARRDLEALHADGDGCGAETSVVLAYVRCAEGNFEGSLEALKPLGDFSTLPPASRSVAAMVAGAVAYAQGRYADAVKLLSDAARHLPDTSFFDRWQRRRVPILPEACSNHFEPVPLASANSIGPRVNPVSGTLRVYLDPFRIPGAHYARFFVDGRCLFTTNQPPLRFDWNTRRVRNGYHKVIIRGEDSSGEPIGEEERVILVRNDDVDFPPLYPESAYKEAALALRRAIRFQPDVLATHYLLGQSLARLGNQEGAAASLEIVMGYEPDYGRARATLKAIYAHRNGHRVRVVSSVPTADRKIAITFDDGPNPLYTPPLLDLLERFHARATMFLVGAQAEAYPDIVREIVEKGHEIADHTFTHVNLRTVDRRGIERELLRCRAALRRITGRSVELFRPPGGNADRAVAEVCAEYGFTTVFWDVFDSWLQKYDHATVLSKLVSGVKPGSIVLLHNGNNKTARIVEPFLEEISRQGYQMVTVSELLASRMPGVAPPTDAPDAPELKDDEPAVDQPQAAQR
ncbi:MAG: polysaccharide deacetylase family protein [Armatimonadota bacterium]|nr:polysaccharide deacetylase family protein [Armatimonadota bacterium]